MIFLPVDWKKYNKPPFYPQWLSRGETGKLVSYDDGLLADIDRQVEKLSNQYDLDTIKGVLLDRLGKLLNESRNAAPDAVYRMFLKLRAMLNSADGTVNGIIKIARFIYASREIKIAPDYPAGLVIEYDGNEQDYFNYNDILKQVIAAGVGFHTRAMFDFIEDPVEIDERMLIGAAADFIEAVQAHDNLGMLAAMNLSDHVYGRSAIVYGGGIQGGAQYNSVYTHNGQLSYRREDIRYKHDGELSYGSGYNDIFASEDLLVTTRADLIDTADMEDAAAETALGAGFTDTADTGEAVGPHAVLLGMEDGVAMDDAFELSDERHFIDTANLSEGIELSGGMHFSDSIETGEEFGIGMIGYWAYGDADNPKHTHDGSIGYNYGKLAPV